MRDPNARVVGREQIKICYAKWIVTNNTCMWRSRLKGLRCKNQIEKDIDPHYCIFHKYDKTEKQAKLFWAILNWNHNAGLDEKAIELVRQYYQIPSEYQAYISNKLLKSKEINRKLLKVESYTDEEINYAEQHPIYHPNFHGFVFPRNYTSNFSFCVANKEKLFNSYDFIECYFEGQFYSVNYEYILPVNFVGCRFNQAYTFSKSIFYDDVLFKDNKFSGGGFMNPFKGTRFNGRKVELIKTNFSQINEAEFSDRTLLIVENEYSKEFGRASFGKEIFRLAKNQAIKLGDYRLAGDHYYREMDYASRELVPSILNRHGLSMLIEYRSKILRKIFDTIIKWTSGYGEKPYRAILASLVIILLYSIGYQFASNLNYADSIYTSFVTYTTLGFGIGLDNVQSSKWVKILLASESFIGVIIMSIFVVTLSKRYVR